MADGSVIIDAKIDSAQYQKGLTAMKSTTDAWAKGTVADFNAVSKGSNALASAINTAKTALAGYVSIQAAKNIATTATNFASLEAAFVAITGSSKGAAQELAYLTSEAQRLGLDITALATSFKGFSAAGKAAGMEGTQVKEIFSSISEAAAIMQLDAQKTERVMYALEQMMSKGTVSMEELRQQLGDQLPGAFSIAAKAMGMTTQEFQKAVEKGEVFSADFLPKFSKAMKENFGDGLAEAVKTPRAEIQRLINTLTLAQAEIGNAGFLRGLADGAKELRASLEMPEAREGLRDIGEGLGSITGILAKAASFAVKNSGTIGEALRVVADNIGIATAAFTAYTIAQRTINAAEGSQVAAIKGKIVALKEEVAAQDESAVATQRRALAAQQEAIASQKAAVVRLAAVKAEAAALDAVAKGMGGTGNLGDQQAAAFARVVQAEKELVAVNAIVASTTSAVDAAQTKATLSARALAGAQALAGKALSGIKALGMGIVNAFGGPVVAGITAVTAAVAYFATRQSESEKVAEQYSATIAGLRGSSEEAQAALGDLEKRISGLSKEMAEWNLVKIQTSIAKLDEELSKFGSRTLELNEYSYDIASPFDDAVSAFREGRMEADEAINSIAKGAKTLDDAGQKEAEAAIKAISALALKRKEYELTQKQVQKIGTSATQTGEKWNDAMKKAASATNDVSTVLSKLDKSGKVQGLEEAYTVIDKLSKSTDQSKKSAADNARAQYVESIAILRKTAEAEEASAAMANMAAQDAIAANQSVLVAVKIGQAIVAMANARRLSAKAAAAEANMANIDFSSIGSGGGGPSPADTIREIREEIDSINNSDMHFVEKLDKVLADIADKGQKAKVPLATIASLQKDMEQAMSDQFIQEYNKELADMVGGSEAAAFKQDELARKLDEVEKAFLRITGSTDQATAARSRYQAASEREIRKENLETQVNFLKEVESLSGQYGISLQAQNELLEMQATLYRSTLPESMQPFIDQWLKLKQQENDPSFGAGIERSAQKFVTEWTDAGKVAEKQFDVMIGAVQQLGSSAIDAIFDGAEFRADQFFKDIAKQLLKIAMNQAIAGLFGSLFGGRKSLPSTSTSPTTGLPGFFSSIKHTGGVAGVPDTNASRKVIPTDFAYAPRFHTGGIAGLRNNEIPAILQRGEGIFTQAQMNALGSGLQRGQPPQVNVIVNTPPGVAVTDRQQTQNAQGGFDITLMLEMVDKAMASGIASGRSKTANAMKMRGI